MGCRRAALGIAVLIAVTGGCSSDGDQTSKAEYVRRAGAICRDAGVRVAKLADELLGQSPDPALQAEYDRRTDALLRDSLRRLRALPRPGGDEATLDRLYAAQADALAAVQAGAESPGAADVVARAERLAKAYGLPAACAGE